MHKVSPKPRQANRSGPIVSSRTLLLVTVAVLVVWLAITSPLVGGGVVLGLSVLAALNKLVE